MTGEFSIEPGVISQAAQNIDGYAQQFGGMVTSLSSTVSTGNPWGSDEPGTVFGTAYTALLGHALEVLQSHSEQLTQAADGLSLWAGTTEQTDQKNASALQSLLGPGAV